MFKLRKENFTLCFETNLWLLFNFKLLSLFKKFCVRLSFNSCYKQIICYTFCKKGVCITSRLNLLTSVSHFKRVLKFYFHKHDWFQNQRTWAWKMSLHPITQQGKRTARERVVPAQPLYLVLHWGLPRTCKFTMGRTTIPNLWNFHSKPFSGNLFLKERKSVSQSLLVDLSYTFSLYREELQANILLMLVAEKNSHNQCTHLVFHVHKTTLLIPPI